MLSYWLTRTTNGLRKVAAGLRPFSESVWPGVRNDLFIAHESIYRFFSDFCRDRNVIDAGCGTGYGAYLLAASGAEEVLGIDIDERNIRYATKHYPAPNLRFTVDDIQQLNPSLAADVVVASNSLEHLQNPIEFVRRAVQLVRNGLVIVAVPPIFTTADTEVHSNIHYHRSNLPVERWLSLFAREGWAVECFAHRSSSHELQIDFASPFSTRLQAAHFQVVRSSREDLYENGAITAIFAIRAPAN